MLLKSELGQVYIASFVGMTAYTLAHHFNQNFLSESLHAIYLFSVMRQGLTEQDKRICGATIAMFQTVLSSLKDGSITAEELRKLDSRREQVIKLIEAGITSLGETKFEVIQHLSKRLEEYRYFSRYRDQLIYLCQNLDELQIQGNCTLSVLLNSVSTESLLIGLKDLVQELKENFETTSISSLCFINDNGAMTIRRFDAARPLDSVVEKFGILTLKHHSSFFLELWNSQKLIFKGTNLQIGDVVICIWQKAFERCEERIKSLHDKSIGVKLVDDLLSSYRSEDTLEHEIQQLEKGVCECVSRTIPNPTWIKDCVKHMYQYKSLCEHASAAKAFLNLKETLELTGDFSVVERLASQVSDFLILCFVQCVYLRFLFAQFAESVQDKSLASITESVIETGQFLSGISSNKGRLKCLEVFAKCQPIVKWIQEGTKGLFCEHFLLCICVHLQEQFKQNKAKYTEA